MSHSGSRVSHPAGPRRRVREAGETRGAATRDRGTDRLSGRTRDRDPADRDFHTTADARGEGEERRVVVPMTPRQGRGGMGIDLGGVPIARTGRRAITAIRSEMASASTGRGSRRGRVMPSCLCRRRIRRPTSRPGAGVEVGRAARQQQHLRIDHQVTGGWRRAGAGRRRADAASAGRGRRGAPRRRRACQPDSAILGRRRRRALRPKRRPVDREVGEDA